MTRAALAVVAVALAAALPVASAALRDVGSVRCATDGVEPGPTLRVSARLDGREFTFCSIRCARTWLEHNSLANDRLANDGRAPDRVVVRDEIGGDEIDVRAAWFARSGVVTLRASGERIHAFASRADAEAHVAAHGGRLLEGDDRPFPRSSP